MKTESGSTRMRMPKCRSPVVSHVQSVDECDRLLAVSEYRSKNVTAAQTNEPNVAAVTSQPASRREMRLPASVIAAAAASGSNRQTQAAGIMRLAPERRQLVDVERELLPRHRHDQTE